MARVFQTPRANFADYTICVVTVPVMADLLVYRDDDAEASAHGEDIWTFVEKRENAHFTVHIRPKGMTGGDLNIAFTDMKEKAGWQRPSPAARHPRHTTDAASQTARSVEAAGILGRLRRVFRPYCFPHACRTDAGQVLAPAFATAYMGAKREVKHE